MPRVNTRNSMKRDEFYIDRILHDILYGLKLAYDKLAYDMHARNAKVRRVLKT